jgi:small-conductance mechanosensitive channel
MTIYCYVLFLVLFGVATGNALAQEDAAEINDNLPTIGSSTASQAAFVYSWWIDGLLVSFVTVVGSVIAYFVFNYFLNRTADSLNLDKGELKGIRSISKMALIVISITIIIFQFSNVSGVVASSVSVAAGTIIGFSSRNTISNAIAGLLLLSSRPFNIGDRIHTTEESHLIGDVMEITLFYTKIKTIRNELVAIPNQTLLQRQIVNYSGLENLAICVKMSLTYDTDRAKSESLMIEAAKNTEGVIIDRPSPIVLLSEFGNYAAIYELRAFTNKPNEFLKIQSDLRKNMFDIFHKNGVEMTVPEAQKTIDSVKNVGGGEGITDSNIDR